MTRCEPSKPFCPDCLREDRAAGSAAPACSADVMGGRAAELMNLARFADDNGLRACGRALRNIAGAFADRADEIRKQNAGGEA